MQMACSQAVQTSSSSFRTALRDCGSGRYFSTESMEVDCPHLLEDGVAVLVVSKVDMVRCRWCWSMLVGNGIMLIKSRVDTNRE